MAFSDQQIRDYALQLEAKGAAPTEIEAFVAGAKGEQKPVVEKPKEMNSADFTLALKNAQTPEEKQAIVAAQGKPSSEGASSLAGQIGNELSFGPRMAAKWLMGHRGEAGNIALRSGTPAVGQRYLGPAGKFLGGAGGEALAQLNEGTGLKLGQILGAGVAQFGRKGPSIAKNALTYGAANVAGQAVGTGIDQGRLPTAQEAGNAMNTGALSAGVEVLSDAGKYSKKQIEAKIRDTVVNDVVAQARAVGLKVLPSKVNPGAINRTLEFIGGRAQTVEDMRLRNEDIARSLALKELGRPQISPRLMDEIEAARKQASVPYQKIEAISEAAKLDAEALKKSNLTAGDYHDLKIQGANPTYVKKLADLTETAAADIKEWRSWRNAEKVHWQSFDRNPSVEVQEKAIEAGIKARELEDKILTMTEKIGQPELYKELKAAQIIYAKSHEIENALSVRDAPDMSKLARSKAPLTGDLATMADLGTQFPKTSSSTRGQGYSDKSSIVRQGVNVATKPIRNLLLSGHYQKFMTTPSYRMQPDMPSQLARFATNSLGRNGNPFLQPLPQSTDQDPRNPFLQSP